MRAVVQRVSEASVTVAGKVVGRTGPGFLVLLCAMRGDDRVKAEQMAAKIVKLRIFEDDAGKMNLSLRDTGGSVLLVSQFTLGADTRGNRPGFPLPHRRRRRSRSISTWPTVFARMPRLWRRLNMSP